MAAFSHQSLLHDPLLYTPNQPSPLFSSHLIYSDLSTTVHDTSSSVEEPQSEKVVMGRKRKTTECKVGKRRMKKSKEEESKQESTPSTGFIHVRARRGQATDSHSLAERVRREKISERMKLLQGLVPGCDKVIGKALMLDEIINYVQSLQHQVEFLSMKLASTDPPLYEYEFGVDLDGYMVQTQKQESNNQAMAFVGTYPMLDTSVAFPQGPSTLPQEHGGLVMHMDEPNHRFLNQLQFNNICSSFQ